MARYAETLTDPREVALWEKILEKEGETFVTCGRGSVPGVPFTYEIPEYKMDDKLVKEAELWTRSRRRNITRSTVMLAYRKIFEMGGKVKDPNCLGTFMERAVFAILKELGETVYAQCEIHNAQSESATAGRSPRRLFSIGAAHG